MSKLFGIFFSSLRKHSANNSTAIRNRSRLTQTEHSQHKSTLSTCHLPAGLYATQSTNLYLWRWECAISKLVKLITRERSEVGGKAAEVRAIPPGRYCTVKSQPVKDPQEWTSDQLSSTCVCVCMCVCWTRVRWGWQRRNREKRERERKTMWKRKNSMKRKNHRREGWNTEER